MPVILLSIAPTTGMQTPLINFLQSDLGIPTESIELAIRHHQPNPNMLPMVLWQYGLVTTEQLDQIFHWLEQNNSLSTDL